jgi:S-adenosylmethionine:tRNA ribosyltransferase-isomerase
VTEPDAPGWLLEHGLVPLPPYIEANGQDPARYQTVYADEAGSVAAPTAGLHFDEQLWARVRERCEVAHVTLHVGAGTFQPVRADDLADHDMHAERYAVPPATDAAVRDALAAGRRVVAIGTTTTRVLESVYGPSALPLAGSTRLFVTPGYAFGCVGAMLTNFHLPRSTLLALVMALAGEATTRAAYAQAIEQRMRFFSFGDAMFVHGQPPTGRMAHDA